MQLRWTTIEDRSIFYPKWFKISSRLEIFLQSSTLIAKFIFYLLVYMPLHLNTVYAADEESEQEEQLQAEQAVEAERLRNASSRTVRQFHEVLDELLAEFGYDIKLGQLKGLKNLAIRKVDVSSALPRTYSKYTKLLVSERIRENSTIRLINCTPCTTKTSKLIEGKLVITSPSTNAAMLKSVANQLGIENFMDIVLVYHTTHMVLAFQIFNAETNESLWDRTYNSETIKSRYQKLAIDYSQVAKSRPGEEYVPEYRLLVGLGGSGIPNVGGDNSDSSMLNLQFRATERFDSRRSEFGMMFTIHKSLNSLMSKYPTLGGDNQESTSSTEEDGPLRPKPFETALGIYGIYAHNFLGSVESYNEVRQGIHFGLGGIISSGYLAGSAAIGWDIFFGRRFVTSFTGLYLAPSKVLVGSETVETKGGAGGSVTVSFNY
ncbi:MAG: hypothetical protein R3B45_14885 [Bdellovibrionota bacterium]